MKSAYYIALQVLEINDEGECSSGDYGSALWRRMWHLNIPAKIKNFAWRACMDGLPTMVNLQKRGINSCNLCPSCTKEPEAISHALTSCDTTKRVWDCWIDLPINVSENQ